MKKTLLDLLQASPSQMTPQELRENIAALREVATGRRDIKQSLTDEGEGKPQHEGFIYVLSNEAMPDLLKIGCTVGRVAKRLEELSSHTGVPTPFSIEAKFPVYREPLRVEEEVHRALAAYRYRPNREFFRLSPQKAIAVVQEILGIVPSPPKPVAPEVRIAPPSPESVRLAEELKVQGENLGGFGSSRYDEKC